MSDAHRAAYNAFRCELAKVHKTFNSCTQTNFTEEVGTETEHRKPQLSDKCLGTFHDYNG